jgi:hypothetical protein
VRALGRALFAASLLGWAAAPASTLAQEREPSPPVAETGEQTTAIRSFLEQRDRLVVEQLDPLPPVPLASGGSVGVAAAWVFEPGLEHRRLLGVRIELAAQEASGAARVFYLDLHEVEELLRAMALMEEAVAGRSRSEARFVSLEGFGVLAHSQGGRPAFAVSAEGATQLRAPLDRDAFALLRLRLEEARERVFSP